MPTQKCIVNIILKLFTIIFNRNLNDSQLNK